MSYQNEFERAREDAEAFWMQQAEAVAWHRAPTAAQSVDANGVTRWFANAELNTAELCLDRHVQGGRGEAASVNHGLTAVIALTYPLSRPLKLRTWRGESSSCEQLSVTNRTRSMERCPADATHL